MTIKNLFWDVVLAPMRIRKLQYLTWAMVDPKGLWFLQLMLENANVPEKYKYMFIPEDKNAVFVDCWMNVWLITDIARFMDMEVYWFEPNPTALNFILEKKYKTDDKVHIYPYAVSYEQWEMNFYLDSWLLFDQWASIVEEFAKNNHVDGWKRSKHVKVKVKRLVDVLKNEILPKHKYIHMLKIDIEWAEFWVVNDIIDDWIYNNIKYIVVETHQDFFKNWRKMLQDLRFKIKKNNINNIFLDWI